METKLLHAWHKLKPDGGPSHTAMGLDLLARYAEPHRVYHGVTHLENLMDWLEQLTPYLTEPQAVTWAIWFHDAIYHPERSDNEAQSASLAEISMRAMGVPEALISTVHNFIIATARHLPRTTHPDEPWFLDMDLAILGSEPLAYSRYARAIRREYQMFQDEVYRPGRQRVLEGLLARPHIYQTAYCMVRLEEQARQNIWHELQALCK